MLIDSSNGCCLWKEFASVLGIQDSVCWVRNGPHPSKSAAVLTTTAVHGLNHSCAPTETLSSAALPSPSWSRTDTAEVEDTRTVSQEQFMRTASASDTLVIATLGVPRLTT